MSGAGKVVVTAGCPFCGWSNLAGMAAWHEPNGGYWVECPDCAAQGPIEATEAEAIAAWNTRAIAPLIEALEAAREALAPFARAQHIVGTVEQDGRVRCILTYQPDADETFTFGSLDAARKATTLLTAALAAQKGEGHG